MFQEGYEANSPVGYHEKHGYDLSHKIDITYNDKKESNNNSNDCPVNWLIVFFLPFGK